MKGLHWLGHASFYVQDGQKIYYIDPYNLTQTNVPHADIIFITHAHHDHLSLADIEKVMTNTTIVVAPKDCLEKIEIDQTRKISVVPNQTYTIDDLTIETLPAYNVSQEKLQYHPRANNWVGYILSLAGEKLYHAGDTDYVPEMSRLAEEHITYALLPMGGTYTMDVQEAAQAANVIGAKVTIPMHYKRLVGDRYQEAEETLRTLVTASRVSILQEET